MRVLPSVDPPRCEGCLLSRHSAGDSPPAGDPRLRSPPAAPRFSSCISVLQKGTPGPHRCILVFSSFQIPALSSNAPGVPASLVRSANLIKPYLGSLVQPVNENTEQSQKGRTVRQRDATACAAVVRGAPGKGWRITPSPRPPCPRGRSTHAQPPPAALPARHDAAPQGTCRRPPRDSDGSTALRPGECTKPPLWYGRVTGVPAS